AADEAADRVAPLATVPSYGNPPPTPRPALASQFVRHIGEPVALIVAETEAQAHEAAFMVDVDYEDLPAVTTRADATASTAPLVWPHAEGNVGLRYRHGDHDAAEAAFAAAAHHVVLDLVITRVAANPIEC